MIKKIHTIMTGDPDSISIILVGCGGTGSFAALNLARLAWSARDKLRFRIAFIDPDIVEEKNVGRQYFCPADVGQPKARVLAARLGLAFGLEIIPIVGRFEAEMLKAFQPEYSRRSGLQLVVGAVDTPAARRDIAAAITDRIKKAGSRSDGLWWLDGGNGHMTGQVLIGNSPNARNQATKMGDCIGVPFPSVQEPALLRDAPGVVDAGALSCAELVALNVQARTINQMVAAWIDVFAERLIVKQDLNIRGVYINQRLGTATPAPITDCLPVDDMRDVYRRVQNPVVQEVDEETNEEFVPCPQCGNELIAGFDTVRGETVEVVFCGVCDWQINRIEYDAAYGAAEAAGRAVRWRTITAQEFVEGRAVEVGEAEVPV